MMSIVEKARWRIAAVLAERGLTAPIQQIDAVRAEDGRIALYVYVGTEVDEFVLFTDAPHFGFDEHAFAQEVFRGLSQPEVMH